MSNAVSRINTFLAGALAFFATDFIVTCFDGPSNGLAFRYRLRRMRGDGMKPQNEDSKQY